VNNLKRLGIGIKLLLFTVVSVLIGISLIVSTALIQFNSFNDSVSREEAIKGMEGLNTLIEDYKEESLRNAKMLSLNREVINAVENKDYNGIYNIVSSIAKQSKIDYIIVTDSNGSILAHTYDTNIKGNSISSQSGIQTAL